MSKKFKRDMFDLSIEEQQELADSFEQLVDNGTIGIYDVKSGMCHGLVDESLAAMIETRISTGELSTENSSMGMITDVDTSNDHLTVDIFSKSDDDIISNINTNVDTVTGNVEITYNGRHLTSIKLPVIEEERSEKIQGVFDEVDDETELEYDTDPDRILRSIEFRYDSEKEIVIISDGYSTFSVALNTLEGNDFGGIHNQREILDQVTNEFLIRTLPNFTPTAVFRKKEFVTQISTIINSFDEDKYYFFESGDFIMAYIINEKSRLNFDDLIDDSICKSVIFPLLHSIETMINIPMYKFNTNTMNLSKFLTSENNQTDLLSSDLFDDPVTGFGNGTISDILIYNTETYEFKFIEFLDRVVAKMTNINPETKSNSKIIKIESDDTSSSDEESQ